MQTCVVVTGSGRSGTSITMGLLAHGGLLHAEDLIPASAQNMRGSFEDREIFECQRQMLSAMGPLTIPPPDGWLRHPATQKAQPVLRDALRRGMQQAQEASQDAPRLWGFKDPHTAYTLRMWLQIFNAEKVTPRLVICVRNPDAVVGSMVRQYDMDGSVAELTWLTRNLSAIRDAAGNMFVAQFDKMVGGDLDHIRALYAYAGLPEDGAEAAAGAFVDASLDHSGASDYVCENPAVRRLWGALQEAQGTTFDRAAVLDAVKACEQEVAAYRGWLSEIRRFHGQQGRRAPAQAQDTAAIQAQKATLETEKATLEAEKATLQRALMQAEDKTILAAQEIARLQVYSRRLQKDTQDKVQRIQGYKTKSDKLAATLKSDLIATRGSRSFQVGHVVMQGLAKPGRNTLAIPWRLIKIVLAGRAVSRHRK